jgi:hypothetical protein
MATSIRTLFENKPLQAILATFIVITALFLSTDTSPQTIAPVILVFVAVVTYNVVDDLYDIPQGSNWIVYGASLTIAGVYLAVNDLGRWGSGLFILAGLWFVFDGVTTIRVGPYQTAPGYLSDPDENIGEVMLRMQTLNVVYNSLEDASEPKTATDLVTDLDLTESRVEDALQFLTSKGRIEQVGDQYRVESSRWARMYPVRQFLVWLPRRIIRPFVRAFSSSYSR